MLAVSESGATAIASGSDEARPSPAARSITRQFGLAPRHPLRAVSVVWAIARGRWCIVSCSLRGVRFTAGPNLRVFGKLHVRGPGQVVFGANVTVVGHTTPWTYSPEARISIGDNALIGDTKFGCVTEITIGRDCILARASIQDTDFHSTHVNRHSPDAPVRVAPVVIGDNVWIAQFAGILPGARIGRNSVVGFATVCAREYPENVVILGHPGKVAGPVAGTARAAASGAPPRADTESGS
jgi:acetyltransferase-like isoleucine patch superfamily enzyme